MYTVDFEFSVCVVQCLCLLGGKIAGYLIHLTPSHPHRPTYALTNLTRSKPTMTPTTLNPAYLNITESSISCQAATPYSSSRIANITCASSGHQRRQSKSERIVTGARTCGSEMLLRKACRMLVRRTCFGAGNERVCVCVCGLG
jgi:hypothetical protein